LLAFPFLIARLPKQFQPGWGMPAVTEVRRALPVVPRVLPDPVTGQWHPVRYSNGATQQIYDRGGLASTALLPGQGQFVGDAYLVNGHYWIWQQPINGPASWIDP